MGGVTKVGANCINCMLAFKERLPLALPGFCGKKGGKLFEARWLQSNFCTFVPSNFLQSAFLTITLSTVYEACGNVQLISRKTEQSNSGGATEKKQGWGLAGFYLRIFLLSLLSSELIKLWVPPPHLLPRRLPVLHGWLCHCQLPVKNIRWEIENLVLSWALPKNDQTPKFKRFLASHLHKIVISKTKTRMGFMAFTTSRYFLLTVIILIWLGLICQ